MRRQRTRGFSSKRAGSERAAACIRARLNCAHASGDSPRGYACAAKSHIGSNARADAFSDAGGCAHSSSAAHCNRYSYRVRDTAAHTDAHTDAGRNTNHRSGTATCRNPDTVSRTDADIDARPGNGNARPTNGNPHSRPHAHADAHSNPFSTRRNECGQSCAGLHAAERARR